MPRTTPRRTVAPRSRSSTRPWLRVMATVVVVGVVASLIGLVVAASGSGDASLELIPEDTGVPCQSTSPATNWPAALPRPEAVCAVLLGTDALGPGISQSESEISATSTGQLQILGGWQRFVEVDAALGRNVAGLVFPDADQAHAYLQHGEDTPGVTVTAIDLGPVQGADEAVAYRITTEASTGTTTTGTAGTASDGAVVLLRKGSVVVLVDSASEPPPFSDDELATLLELGREQAARLPALSTGG